MKLWSAVACLLVVALLSMPLRAEDNPHPAGLVALDGRTAPALALANMDGQRMNLQTLRGKWVLVHFWASWCGPCRREMPTLQALQQQLKGKRITLLLVNTAETDDDVFAFMPTVAPELNTLMDKDGQVTERWQPRGLPSTFIVDPNGRLRYLALGGRDWTSPEYLAFLNALLSRRH